MLRKKKKNSFPAEATVWSLHGLPTSAWVFPGPSCFLPCPKMCTLGEWACLHGPSVSEGACVCEYALRWDGGLFTVTAHLGAELPGWSLAT